MDRAGTDALGQPKGRKWYSEFVILFLRSLLAYFAFVTVFAPFSYFSDYVPLEEKAFLGEPPQFEAFVLVVFLVILSPLVAGVTAGLVTVVRRVPVIRKINANTRVEKRTKIALVLILAAGMLSQGFRIWIPHISGGPYWQCEFVAKGYGLATLAFLVILFWKDFRCRAKSLENLVS